MSNSEYPDVGGPVVPSQVVTPVTQATIMTVMIAVTAVSVEANVT